MSTIEKWGVVAAVFTVAGTLVAVLAYVAPRGGATAAMLKSPPPSTTPAATPTDDVSPADDSLTAAPSDSDEPSDESPAPSDSSSAPSGAATFSTVDLSPLCDSGDCSGTQQVADKIFAYTDEAEACTRPNYCQHKAFQQGPTSCRYLDVQFAGDEWAQNDGHPTVDYLKFVQESHATVYATVKVGKVGKVRVPLDGGPLMIDAAVENDPGVHNSYVLLKVIGSCSTPDGVPS